MQFFISKIDMRIITIFFYLCVCTLSYANGDDDCRAIINSFFEDLGKNDINAATVKLFNNNLPSDKRATLELKVSEELKKIVKNLGNPKGFDPVVAKLVGTRIFYCYGFAHFEAQEVRFEFIFYKNDKNWQLFNINIEVDATSDIRYSALNFTEPENNSK
ncbi:MAG: hypothetical protein B9S32_12170 [Verrucomicrobia bacterium Tous-C9LFEB]|nr:MAG: hypothetical protein B9S32_12170 [Verrucomicrobia bacterium Tous-C9LFEB]